MSTDENPRIGEVLPVETWEMLKQDSGSVLIDVRTHAEWGFVGIPDLGTLQNPFLMVEWAQLPNMSVNPGFVDKVMEQLWGRQPAKMFFLCRSGVRSLSAAQAVAAHLMKIGQVAECVNVLGGFEGDKDAAQHRGTVNGWKVAGLPWRQS